MPSDATPVDATTVSWTVTPDTERWLWVLSYGLFAVFLGVGLWVVVGLCAFLVVAVLEGSWELLVFVVAAVALALARPPILAVVREERASVGYEGWQPSRRGLVAAALVGATALGVGFAVSEVAVAAVVVLGTGASLLAMALTSEATVDARSRTLTTRRSEASTAGLSGVRSLAVGPVVLCWLTYVRGAATLRTPRLLTVPRETAPAVRAALQAGVEASADADPIGRAERAVVVLFGLGTLAVAPGLWLLTGGDGRLGGMLAYLWLLSLVVVVPMLWYAVTA